MVRKTGLYDPTESCESVNEAEPVRTKRIGGCCTKIESPKRKRMGFTRLENHNGNSSSLYCHWSQKPDLSCNCNGR